MKSDIASSPTAKSATARARHALAEMRDALLARAPWLGSRQAQVWGAWAVTRLLLFVGMLTSHSYTDPVFYHYAGLFATGHWPYRDFKVEYPPLAMALILLPALPLLLFGGIAPRPVPAFLARPVTQLPHPDAVRYGGYGMAFAVEMLLVDALTLWLVVRVARVMLRREALATRAGLVYVALVFLTGALLQKFDLATGALCLGALYARVERRPALAGAALALAALVKGFPVLVLPLFVLCLVGPEELSSPQRAMGAMRAGRMRSAARCVGAFVAVIAAPTAIVIMGASLGRGLTTGLGAVWHTLTYHVGREFEIESVWASVMLALGWLPGLRPSTSFNGDDLSRVVHSTLERPMAVLSTLALLGAVALVAAAAWRSFAGGPTKRLTNRKRTLTLGWATIAMLLAFMVSFRALPAHYLLAVAPLGAAMALGEGRSSRRGVSSWLWLASIGVVAVVGQILAVPPVWDNLTLLEPWTVALLLLRNCAWMVAFLMAVLFTLRGDTRAEAAADRGGPGGA